MNMNKRFAAAAALVLLAGTADAKTVVMVSVDGMNPEYVTEAAARGINMPNLQRFMREGCYASGVTGVLPTVSWPSATTLMTGVEPARHGVLNNPHFVAPDRNQAGSIYLFASDVKADTLWDAAARSGRVTANVDQLVSVGNPSVRYDIPRFEPFSAATDNHAAIAAAAHPVGLLADLEAKLGPYVGVDFDNPDYDRSRTRFAIEILHRYHPQFLTVHLSGVDVNAHAHAPYSPEAKRAAENIDGLIGELKAAALRDDPDTVVVVVSDHGQIAATRVLNARLAFAEAGLIDVAPLVAGQKARVTGWQADFWGNAVMLKNPADAAVKARVGDLLHRLAADPDNGIVRVLDEAEIRKLGGFPNASFLLEMKDGTILGSDLVGSRIRELPAPIGFHGELPSNHGMNAAFFIAGKGVKPGRNLGQIDMRQIAPTVAKAIGVKLKDAVQPVLPVFVDDK